MLSTVGARSMSTTQRVSPGFHRLALFLATNPSWPVLHGPSPMPSDVADRSQREHVELKAKAWPTAHRPYWDDDIALGCLNTETRTHWFGISSTGRECFRQSVVG